MEDSVCDFEKFYNKYKPIDGPDNDVFRYEYDVKEDMEVVGKTDCHYVWTVVEAEGKMYLIPGKHLVDRQFYVICEIPWVDEREEYEY